MYRKVKRVVVWGMYVDVVRKKKNGKICNITQFICKECVIFFKRPF
jgi:hypothetical protein